MKIGKEVEYMDRATATFVVFETLEAEQKP